MIKYLTPVSLFFFKDIEKALDLFLGITLLLLWSLFLMFASFSYLQHKENEDLKEENRDLLTRLGRL
ncbi:MAG TPA: hypothetical protein VLN45_00970 [Ignavibacteriaceae bacterium]|nr:hypothetical protein [Ignavibacteriaceae bacterium]